MWRAAWFRPMPNCSHAEGLPGRSVGGELRNCSFSGEITVSSLFYTGGVAGALMGGALTGCVNRAAVKCLHPSNCAMGGVVGELYGTVGKEALVAGCINYGAVSGPAAWLALRPKWQAILLPATPAAIRRSSPAPITGR